MSYGKNNPNRISNIPLREPFLNSPLSTSEIARQLGVISSTTGKMETSGLQRMLGLRMSPGSRHKGKVYSSTITETIDVEIAKSLCRILGEDFDALYADEFPVQAAAAHCKTCGNPMLKRHRSRECGLCLLEREELGRLDYAAAA